MISCTFSKSNINSGSNGSTYYNRIKSYHSGLRLGSHAHLALTEKRRKAHRDGGWGAVWGGCKSCPTLTPPAQSVYTAGQSHASHLQHKTHYGALTRSEWRHFRFSELGVMFRAALICPRKNMTLHASAEQKKESYCLREGERCFRLRLSEHENICA